MAVGCCLVSLFLPAFAQKKTIKKPSAPTKDQLQSQLSWAIQDSNLGGVKRALTAGANPNGLSVEGRLPLQDAVISHQWEIGNWLRLKGADIKKAGPPILLAAAEIGDPDALRYVFRFGIKGTGLFNWDDATPLVACAGGDDSEADWDVELQDKGPVGGDPVADARRLEAMRLLLDSGLQPNQGDKNGQLPLHAAAEKGRVALVNLLLEKGAAVDSINKRGLTPIFSATPFPARSLQHKKVRDLLFSKGANINIGVPENGRTPFHYAIYEGREDLVKEFLDHKADVNAPLLNGQTPLIIAMLRAQVSTAHLLLKNGADVQRNDKSGKTALDYENYGIGDTEAQKEIDLSNPQTREFFDEAMQGKINAKFWADIKKRRAEIASMIRQSLKTATA